MRPLSRLAVSLAVISLLPHPALSQNPVVDWNNTAVGTIVKTVNSGGITPTSGMTGIYLAYVNLAVISHSLAQRA